MDYEAEARLRGAARSAGSAGRRLHWLQRAADLVNSAVLASKQTPCGGGCSHCCRIPVVITQVEAFAIADLAGLRRPVRPANSITGREAIAGAGKMEAMRSRNDAAYTGTPCPFLTEGRCKVYAARPLACRMHASLEETSDRCDPQSKEQPPRRLSLLDRDLDNIATLGLGVPVADIRDWFRHTAQLQNVGGASAA